ncbi:MAG: UDP-N-acetylmuramate:L-alanyl-gamma-D-glutamyl-meso-diaminopimelate ligase, partial [Verrucomicrobiales bacterium]|nr:UDP-N-acetylmuramate:L-alanyl-gamma-D-glutamyl-meso-diaminopimelate ligase [Verrucomicrobiales bacterium]
GHHPTALKATLAGFRQRYPGRRLWAVFEPRSNTSRRNVLQPQLIEALSTADGAVVAAVNDAGKVPLEERLDPEKVSLAVTAAGTPCFHEPDVTAIVERLRQETTSGDVLIIFSNGGFDGIHDKLLAAL